VTAVTSTPPTECYCTFAPRGNPGARRKNEKRNSSVFLIFLFFLRFPQIFLDHVKTIKTVVYSNSDPKAFEPLRQNAAFLASRQDLRKTSSIRSYAMKPANERRVPRLPWRCAFNPAGGAPGPDFRTRESRLSIPIPLGSGPPATASFRAANLVLGLDRASRLQPWRWWKPWVAMAMEAKRLKL
jgi:hypothetical protein